MSDKELMRLLRRDPQKGFDMLVRSYGGLLYALVRGRLSPERYGSAEVEDVVADSISDFYISLRSFDPARCSIKSYLCVIARNKTADILRKNRVTELTPPEAEDVIDVAETVEESELRTALLCEINGLGEPDSLIIIRKYYLGQSSKDIAAALDMTVSNVDTRAHRAIKKLREVFS